MGQPRSIDDIACAERVIRDLLNRDAQESATFEMDLKTANGERVRCENHIALLHDDDGSFRGSVGILRDISERKAHAQTLEALHDVATNIEACDSVDRVCEQTLTAAEELLDFPNCVINVEEDGMLPITAISEAVPSDGATTLSVDEGIAGKTYRTGKAFFIDDGHANDEANPQGPYRSAISIPTGNHGAFQTVSEDTGFFDDDDLNLAQLLVAHTAGTLTRITREEAVRAERDRFAALVEMIPEPVVQTRYEDGDPVIEAVNSAFETTFGYHAEDIRGESLNAVIVPDDRLDEAHEIDERARTGAQLTHAVQRRTADGMREFLFRSAPMNGEGDEHTEHFGIYIDISDRKHREQQLERQNERLEAFTSVVSHDLRNPLDVALGQLELAQTECESAHLEETSHALQRMEQSIQHLLKFAQHGRMVEETEPVALDSVVEDVLTNVPAGDDLAVEVREYVVCDDRDRLVQALENLFLNAIEHAGADVSVRVDRLINQPGFYVADDGPGIPVDERDRVFEHGYSSRDDGTGFGLFVVRSSVDAHDWEITVTDNRAGGARVEITGVDEPLSPTQPGTRQSTESP